MLLSDSQNEILNATPPKATSTYSPVAHKTIFNAALEELDKKNLKVNNIILHSARNNQQLIGCMDVNNDDELGFRIAFRNSYDKTMSVGFVAGTNVFVCSNGMLNGDIHFMRKHTGAVSKELHKKIEMSVLTYDDVMNSMEQDCERMKYIEVDKTAAASLCGQLFVEQDLITATQLSIIKNEIIKPSYDYRSEGTMWQFYNHVTHSLKKTHPSRYIEQHKNFHGFVKQLIK